MPQEGAVTQRSLFEMFMQSQHWSKDQLLAFQRSQLEQLLRHAKANIPFYKTRLNCMFRPDGTIDWQRWQDIPILTREDLRDHGEKLLAKKFPESHGIVASFESSGSTGIPVKVTTTALADMVRQALWARFYAVNKLDQTGRHIVFWFTKPGKLKFIERYFVDEATGLTYGNRNLTVQKQLDVLRDAEAEVFSEFSTTLVHMAYENLRREKPVRLKVIVPYGMAVTAEDLAVLKLSFGARVMMPYSSKEAGLIGYHILPDTQYHVCAEALLPEFLPLEGHQGSDLRRLIVTPFFNAAQPLIRYDQGDVVELNAQISASSSHPVLSRVVGRSDDYFVFDGKRVPVVGLQDDTLNKLLKASAFQLAQTSLNSLELRYVAKRQITAGVKSALTRHVRESLQHGFDVSYVKLKSIPANSGGKQQRFKREALD